MPKIENIFLDDGGTLNDNSLRGPQWQRLVGEFFAPRLGGAPEEWARANTTVFWQAFSNQAQRRRAGSLDDPQADWEQYLNEWLTLMCEAVGVPRPVSPSELLALAQEGQDYIMPLFHAGFPGAALAVQDLSQSFQMFTASGGCSWELQYAVGNLGLGGIFRRLYGVDLVRTPKSSPLFYQRIFADASVDPATALVVDDTLDALRWARGAGAGLVVLVSPQSQTRPDVDAMISSLAALPVTLTGLST